MTITYLGNFPSLVNLKHIDFIKNNIGEVRPNDHEEDEEYKADQIRNWKKIVPDWQGFEWIMYYYKEMGMSSPSDLSFPDELGLAGIVNWWYVKINPCRMFPLHVDAFEQNATQFRRLWIPMQDYIPGHVFIYEGKNLEGYSAGDVYEFTNSRGWHGAANIGFEPKISLQVVAYQ
jgi:hypothetical protein